jgi:hypothetical protein
VNSRLELERHIADALAWLGPNHDLAERIAGKGPGFVRDPECAAIIDAALALHRRPNLDPGTWVRLVAGELKARGGDPRWLFRLGAIGRGLGRAARSAGYAVDLLDEMNRTDRAVLVVAEALDHDPAHLADRLRHALDLLETGA